MSTHSHPKPTIDRLSQIVSLIGAGLLAISAVMMVILVIFGAPGGLLIAVPVMLALAMPLVMRTAVAPGMMLDADGLTIQPLIWRDRIVPWGDVMAVKRYPLLPSEDAEVTRRIAVGRRNYRPADGLMLVIPGLPPQYRIASFFAGEKATVVALTNRAHTEYESAVETILAHTDPAIHDDELFED